MAVNIEDAVEELRERNEPVSKPLRLPTEAEITAAEQKLGMEFPADYIYFLSHGSDITCGTIEPAVVTPGAGHLDLVKMAKNAWKLGVPRDLLPFCETSGDYFCLQSEGHVVFWSHEGLGDETWPDLAHWIQEVWLEEEEDADEEEE